MTGWRARLLVCAFAALGGAGALAAADRANPPDMTRASRLSPEVTDRKGGLLRAFLSPDGAWRIRTTPDQVGPRYLAMLKAYEDRHFDTHPGVDPVALVRAALQFAGAGHIVSGGSTLTMQVARLLEPHPHSLPYKLLQIVRALQLEERYSKDEILSLYLTLAPMGGNLEGVRAASLTYFGKEPATLDLAQSALLVALPQSPSRLRPDRHARAAAGGRDKVLARMAAEGVVTPGDARVAMTEGVPFARQAMPLAAPHLAQHLVLAQARLPIVRASAQEGEVAIAALALRRPEGGKIVTTLDAGIQAAAERLAAQERAYFRDGADIALVVVDNESRDVLAYVGGTDYWGKTGQVDLAARARSPGSALKPFIYGLAFDDLILHPLSLMEDAPTRFGDYAPRDFDGGFLGAVTARDALQMSLNIPAVTVLDRVGPLAFTLALENAGAHLVFPTRDAPSLPVALGGLGISVADMAMLYAGIADGGQAGPLHYVRDAAPGPCHRLFGPVAAYYVRDVLDGVALPDGWAMGQGLLKGRTIGFKTGTSYGFRDAWSAGFSNDYTVVVWVGRADGTPRPDRVGRDAAAPVLLKLFALLPPDRRPAPPVPAGALLVRSSAELPPSLRRFTRMEAPPPVEAAHLPPPAIAFPPNGAVVPLPDGAARDAAIQFKADGGRAPLTWLVDGAPIGSFDRFAPALYTPHGEGLARVTVVDAEGRSDSSEIRFKKMR